MLKHKILPQKSMDFVAMGRINVDLYPNEMNAPFDQIISFKKSVGGSPANIALGTARLGVKTGFIGKVSGDQLGAFILGFFTKEKIDISQIKIDDTGAMNCLALTEVKNPKDCSAIIYRDNVADLNLKPDEISEEYVRNAKILLISGTALSKSPSREAVYTALDYANRHNTATFLDFDYRDKAWSTPDEASFHYQKAAEKCDVLIGTKEEIDILNRVNNDITNDDALTAKEWLRKRAELVIIKYGEDGSIAYAKDGTIVKGVVFPAKVQKTYGAGDAYASALVFGILHGWDLSKYLEYAAASAAIVISRNACGESSPTEKEIMDYIEAVNARKL